MKVKIHITNPIVGSEKVPIPTRMSENASGYDVWSPMQRTTLWPGERMLVPLGFSLEIPPGFECQIRPRSGLALRKGVTVLNSPGTIDADYRGELGVILVNLGQADFRIEKGERIAQLVFCAVESPALERAGSLDDTDRGAGGFGSTGRGGQ